MPITNFVFKECWSFETSEKEQGEFLGYDRIYKPVNQYSVLKFLTCLFLDVFFHVYRGQYLNDQRTSE